MAISLYNIKYWTKMILGKSISHVNQDEGKFYNKGEITGYYNNLMDKVLKQKPLGIDQLPLINTQNMKKIEFSTAIFQYGLGAFDLYLQTKDNNYYTLFIRMADWAVENQNDNGSFDTFSFIYPDNPHSAMAQGEATSLLLRAYSVSGIEKYLISSRKAIDFMLLPIELGGTSDVNENDLYLKEFTHKQVVLNGWIFAIFGLYDFCLISDEIKYKDALDKTLRTLSDNLDLFDNNYWSNYNFDATILSSRFYHKLHIAQLSALYQITGINKFYDLSYAWSQYDGKIINRIRAFIMKSLQKIRE